MAKKEGIPWLLVGGVAAGLWWLFSGQTASASTTQLSAAAQSYMSQIMAAQNAFLTGSKTQAQYAATANDIMVKAASDPRVSTSDVAALGAVAGGGA